MNKKILIACGILGIVIVGLVSLIFVEKTDINKPGGITIDRETEIVYDDFEKGLIEEYEANKVKNDDYVGQIKFTSGLVDLPIVQTYDGMTKSDGSQYNIYDSVGNLLTTDEELSNGCSGRCNGNDVYLYTDWETMKYNFWGSNFADYRNNLYDQNYIIYSHHASRYHFGDEAAEEIQGTKLDYLLKKENYDNNKTFYFVTENDIRQYEVAFVSVIDATAPENSIIYRNFINMNFDGTVDPKWSEYLSLLKNNRKYNTGVGLKEDDNLITISTCIQGDHNNKEIIVAKLVSRKLR